jgi:WD40 repeat protein/predicted Ser/Thr protein kinase
MTSEVQRCDVCGTPLSGRLAGNCPTCLMGLASTVGSSDGNPIERSVSPESVFGQGRRLGDYELLEEIARGGMGVVYRARQLSLKRTVAVKVLLTAEFANETSRKRFRREAEAAAGLTHPNIVSIYEIGEHEGQPYFAMELIEGQSLAELNRDKPVPGEQAARWLKTIAEAVHFAHQHGVLHRDLKPSNVLVDRLDVPHVTDFGLAKQDEAGATLTLSGQVLGTPSFMPPEQADPRRGDTTAASDVYSLGAILYHLLTNRPPFIAETLTQTLRLVAEAEPVSPRLLNPGAPRDLETICLKCLEKDPRRRYSSAQALAAELGHFLNNEPIEARPPSKIYRFQKLVRRNRLAFGAGAAVGGALAIGLAVSAWQAIRATRAQGNEATARLAAERLLYAADLKLAYQAWDDGNLAMVRSLLNAHRPKAGETDNRGFEYFCLEELAKGEQEHTFLGHTNSVFALAISPDNRWLASRGKTDTRLWDLKQRRQVAVWPAPVPVDLTDGTGFGEGISFSHDSSYLVLETEAGLQLCQLPSLQTRSLNTGPASRPLFSPVTNWIAFDSTARSQARVAVWDYLTDKPVGYLPSSVYVYCWSTDGSRLLTTLFDTLSIEEVWSPVEWWDLSTFQCVGTNRAAAFPFGAAVAPNGRLTAVADAEGDISLVDSAEGKLLGSLPSGAIRLSALAFSTDSKFLATPSRAQPILIWDLESRKRVGQLRGHEGRVICLAYSPDGKLLASGAEDGAVMLWEATRGIPPSRSADQPVADSCKFSGDGKWVALSSTSGAGFAGTMSRQHSLEILNSSNIQTVAVLRGTRAFFSPDSSQIAVAGESAEPALQIYKVGASSPRAAVRFDSPYATLLTPRVSLDGAFVSAHEYRYASDFLFDASSGERLLTLPNLGDFVGHCLLPGGRLWAQADGQRVSFWNLRSQQKEFVLEIGGSVLTMTASADGRLLALSRTDNKISLWDLETRVEVACLSGHHSLAWALAFAPDGRTLASGSEDRMIKLWDLATRREVASLAMEQEVFLLAFSPDSQTLISGGKTPYQIWRAPRGQSAKALAESQAAPLELPINSIWRLPDGHRPAPTRVLDQKEKCFTNLLKIHAAIVSYRNDHHQVPDRLGDLVPAYLSDTNTLMCPDHARTWLRANMPTPENPHPATTYAYQFRAQPFAPGDDLDGLAAPGDTMKVLRTKQLELYGGLVPVLRCELHPTTLNQAYSGEQFESEPDDWAFAAVRSLQTGHPAEFEEFCRRMEQRGTATRLQMFAWRWATALNTEERDGNTAVRFANKAVELWNRQDPETLDTLAAAYAEIGQFDDAARLELEAISLSKGAPAKFKHAPQAYNAHLALYRQHKPYRE